MFKVGDKIVCKHDNFYDIEKGKIYTIKNIEEPIQRDERWKNVDDEYVEKYLTKPYFVLDEIDDSWSFPSCDFILLSDLREEKLKRILDENK
jgi:hypothetical protein